MEIQKRVLSDGAVRWRVRWRQGNRYRAMTFDRKGDAVTFAAELRRRQQIGTLASLDGGRQTLAEYVTGTWAPRVQRSPGEEDPASLRPAVRQAHPARARFVAAA